MKLSKIDINNLTIILFYSLIFLIIRLAPSLHSMTYDEAEQFFDASSYQLGYLDQPPLYSWILKTLSIVFGLNIPMMVIVYHLIIIVFLLSFYFTLREVWQDKYSWIIFCSLSFFFIYSYDFYRYTIHTALAMMFCSLSLLSFIRVYKYKLIKDYLLLGLFFGLGLLAKYNFLFFIIVLVIACLFNSSSRKVLLHPYSLISITIMCLTFYPHLAWLIDNNFPSVSYALERGEAGKTDINYLAVLLNTFWNYFLYIGVFAVFFGKDFNPKHLKSEHFFSTLRVAGALSVLLPLFLILVLQSGNFSQRWMAPINIFLILALFSFVEFKESSKRYQLFFITCIIMTLIFYGARVSSYYLPDIFKPSFISIPYKDIYQKLREDIEYRELDFSKTKFIGYKEYRILAGIKIFHPQANLELFKKTNYPHLDQDFNHILVWEEKDEEKINLVLEELQIPTSYLFTRSANYLYADKLEAFKVNFALIQNRPLAKP
jgi:4-amino-4-deoxy-L-arabinose transferase-like glycosyltransferase